MSYFTSIEPSKVTAGIETLTELERRLLFAYYARMAYKTDGEVKEILNEFSMNEHEFIGIDNAEVHVFYNEHDLIVSCRGTEPTALNDVMADLEVIKTVWSSEGGTGYVHQGFKHEVDKVYEGIHNYIKKHGKDKKIWVTGHSLGAAMATLVAAKLTEDGEQITYVYSFGSPRAGGSEFATWCDKNLKHKRFVNNNDIVPCVPTAFRWQHSGECHYIKSSGEVTRLGRWSMERVLDKGLAIVEALFHARLDSVSDHSMNDYIEQLSLNK